MTGFGKMAYGLVWTEMAVATCIIWVTGVDSRGVKLFFIIVWIFLIILLIWDEVKKNQKFKEYQELYDKLERQYKSRGRMGEKNQDEKYLLMLGEFYIREGIFGEKRTSQIQIMMNQIEETSNEKKEE